MDRRGFVLAALALGGCATAGRPPVASGSAHGPLAELEPVYSVVSDPKGLTLQIASNGCTSKADITFYVERRGEAVGLALARKQVDVCKAPTPGRAEVAFTWAELGLASRTPVFLLNPVAPPGR